MSNPQDILPVTRLTAHTLSATPVEVCQCIVAEVAGRVNLTLPDDSTVTNFPLVAGFNPVKAKVINNPSAGTAATGIFLGRR